VWQELWGFGGVVAAASLSTFSSHRLALRPAMRAKLAPPCGFGSATRIFFLRLCDYLSEQGLIAVAATQETADVFVQT
jgi:hypothetical protein